MAIAYGSLWPYRGIMPQLAADVWLAPGAQDAPMHGEWNGVGYW